MTVLTWPLDKSGTVILAKPCAEDLRTLIELYVVGKLPVTIDSRFPLPASRSASRSSSSRRGRGSRQGRLVAPATSSVM